MFLIKLKSLGFNHVTIFTDLLKEPILLGLVSLAGLVALKKTFHKVMVGTLKVPIFRVFNAWSWCRRYSC